MNGSRSIMVCIVLATMVAPATAQVVTRDITEQPVETTITRYPGRTIVTRRPLPQSGAISVEPEAAPAIRETERPVVTDPGVRSVRTITIREPAIVQAPVAPIAIETATSPITSGSSPVPSVVTRRSVTTRQVGARRAARRETVGAAPRRHLAAAHVRTVRSRAAPARLASRTILRVNRTAVRRTSGAPRAGQPLALTLTQRRIVYRYVVQQQIVPAPVAAEVVTFPDGNTVVQPAVTTGAAVAYASPTPPVSAPFTGSASPGYPVTYTVGSAIPASVPRAPVPQTVMLRVPQAQAYQYAVVNNRVLLINPLTGTVVADVTP